MELKELFSEYDTILIGVGAGLSTSAGFTYSGERFHKYFGDFEKKYGIRDMYSGGFYPYKKMEEFWAWWSRQIWINRYKKAPIRVYEKLFELVQDKDYFVLTTNVDHCFQKAGFDKSRLFYTQGDYGLFQCSSPCCQKTYNNKKMIEQMLVAQGFKIAEDGELVFPEGGFSSVKMEIPSQLIPRCPECGKPMNTNLRADDSFVQNEGWYKAAERYEEFLNDHNDSRILFLELGVGVNTPGIIKYPFWKMTYQNLDAFYVCINKGEAVCPEEIKKRLLCINDDIWEVVRTII